MKRLSARRTGGTSGPRSRGASSLVLAGAVLAGAGFAQGTGSVELWPPLILSREPGSSWTWSAARPAGPVRRVAETWFEHAGSNRPEGVEKRVVVEYDPRGNRIREEEWWGSEKLRWALWSRDSQERLRSWIESDWALRQRIYEYDALDRVARVYVEGPGANPFGPADELSRAWVVCDYDETGRLLSERWNGAAGALTSSLECEYTEAGRLVRILRLRPSEETRVVYALEHDAQGRVTLESMEVGRERDVLPSRAIRYDGERPIAVRYHDENGSPYAVELHVYGSGAELVGSEWFGAPAESSAACGPLDSALDWSERSALLNRGLLRTVSEYAGAGELLIRRQFGADERLRSESSYVYEHDERGNWILCSEWARESRGEHGAEGWSARARVHREIEYYD